MLNNAGLSRSQFSPLLDPATEIAAEMVAPQQATITEPSCRPGFVMVACLGVIAVLVSMAIVVQIGVAEMHLGDLVRIAGSRMGFDVEPLSRMRESLIWDLRLPRILAAALVGAALAVCGAVLQALTGNALADPYLLGISGGASTGAVCVVILGLGGGIALSAGAFVGAMVVLVLLLVLLHRDSGTPLKLVLTGVLVGQFFAAITSLVVMAAGDAETTRGITYWLLGSLTAARWTPVLILSVFTIGGGVIIWAYAHVLDAMAFGSDTAKTMGVNVKRARFVLLVACALMTATAVAMVGAIGFIGLIVPHAARLIVGPLHSQLIPFSATLGAGLLIWTDALARTVLAPQEIPVGVFTALIGVPLFLLLLRRRGDL
ncbi:FecCD family ABC transporter permease [Pacificibacter marinus]|uniref:FecCD family ABC transporter permease n=1 Tax=Pacificibacter marinus TaxID=658057 RepID=UPI001C0762D6|nr:iron chelate uptake ABC transporter family permease subunit [Pacificibacter marinus]MBU2867901.1 iron ABC transporter permease [Pacificibacter marinus]